ncbi:MAG TPA: endolytic transglycosylase MltG [Thermodesulfobacteriota bacterium]|nr:endolytic transglycosylase MltG [Thermodesulfobacteriota bacterium]
MGSGRIKTITVTILILLVLGASALLGVYYYITGVPVVSENKVVDIPKGRGLKKISAQLEEEGVIGNGNLFLLYVVGKGWQNRLKAGEYEFGKGSTTSEVARKIAYGDVVLHKVTIPEGLTMKEIAALLGKNGVLDPDGFLTAAGDPELLKILPGRSITGLEGYLFPDTYTYTKGVTPGEFVRMMLDRFNKVYKSLEGLRRRVNLTDNEVITLASIIEKETGAPAERPMISAVFHNRLKLGMKLESDPTVIYGLGEDYDGNLTKADLNTMTQYNTYLIKGLPPGPICNPGKESITAALSPAAVDYIYFVSRGDGTHYFSENYADHQRAVSEYQR